MQRREQFRDAVLNYLDEESQVGQRAQFDRKARLMRNRFGVNVDPNAGSSVAAQAKARHNQRMATKRFGQGAFAGAGNTAAAQAASDRQMRQTSKRFQRREEQFKNAVLNYLEETEETEETEISRKSKRVSNAAKNAKKYGGDAVKAADKAVARLFQAGDEELDRSDEERSKDDAKLAKERKRINNLQDSGYSQDTQPKVKSTQPKLSFLDKIRRAVRSPAKNQQIDAWNAGKSSKKPK